MARTIKFAPKEFYHIYNRGIEKRDIFMTRDDYERFLALLYICNQSKAIVLKTQGKTMQEFLKTEIDNPLIDIATYCLMPNHIHILAREKQDNGISKFMQKVMTGYTMYFNKKYERTGSLFQGTFKATHVNDNRYLAYLISYIHLNPIKLIEPEWKEIGITNLIRAEKYLKNYRHSSYVDFLDKDRIEKKIINKKTFPEYFNSTLDFKRSIIDWLTYPHPRLNLG